MITHKDVTQFDSDVLRILNKLWTRYGIKSKVNYFNDSND